MISCHLKRAVRMMTYMWILYRGGAIMSQECLLRLISTMSCRKRKPYKPKGKRRRGVQVFPETGACQSVCRIGQSISSKGWYLCKRSILEPIQLGLNHVLTVLQLSHRHILIFMLTWAVLHNTMSVIFDYSEDDFIIIVIHSCDWISSLYDIVVNIMACGSILTSVRECEI